MSDPLAEFRRKGSASPERATPRAASEREPYVAFQTKDRVPALDILCKDGSGHSATYNYLLYVTFDWRDNDAFFLVYGSLMVKVEGRNLREVVKALRLRKCEFLCEYDSDEFDPPADDAPVITSIVIVRSQAAEAALTGQTPPGA